MAAASTTRRRFLGLVAGAALAVSGVVAALRTRGYTLPADRAARLEALAVWQAVVVEHVARRIAAPDRAGDSSIPTPDDTDVAGFVDAYVARMPAALRRDLSRLFAYVEHLAPLRAGLATRFTRLGPTEQDRVLAAMEASDQSLLRGAFAGLKSLVFMGYYRDPRTWSILAYDGPLVDRPAEGWGR